MKDDFVEKLMDDLERKINHHLGVIAGLREVLKSLKNYNKESTVVRSPAAVMEEPEPLFEDYEDEDDEEVLEAILQTKKRYSRERFQELRTEIKNQLTKKGTLTVEYLETIVPLTSKQIEYQLGVLVKQGEAVKKENGSYELKS